MHRTIFTNPITASVEAIGAADGTLQRVLPPEARCFIRPGTSSATWAPSRPFYTPVTGKIPDKSGS
jgi:hypothetical protein